MRSATGNQTNQLYYKYKPHPGQNQSTDQSPLFNTGYSRGGQHLAIYKTEQTDNSAGQDGDEQGAAEFESRNIVHSTHDDISECSVAHEQQSDYQNEQFQVMDTVGHSEVAGKMANGSRKSSKNRHIKHPSHQSVKNDTILGKKFHLKK